MYLGYLISWLHPILIHFPIVLFLGAWGAEIYGIWRRDPAFSNAGKVLLMLGCVISLFAFVTGNFAEVFAVRAGTPHDPVDLHAIWAMMTTWCFIGLTVMRFFTPMEKVGRHRTFLVGLTLSLGLLLYTAHQGGDLVYRHGAAVEAMHETHTLDMKDMRDLYQEQTVESIVYSEMMHHIFGWLVLAMSLFLISSKIWPEQTRKAWRMGPFLLFAGGVFLMIFSDTDSWPLSNARPIYDKEVLQHKIFASLMLGAGVISLIRRKRQASDAPPGASYHLGLALLALVGGGLLFTHVHSVAPYSNRAIGVYLHHMILGFFAISAGAAAFWEAMVPKGPGWRKYLWASILLIESVLLINYNEDIPPFIRILERSKPWVGHESRYELMVESLPKTPSAGEPCELTFRLKDVQQNLLPPLEVVHENPLHLMIVYHDLSSFDHIHPELQKDGSLKLKYTFEHGGEFLLFADAKPKDAATQSYRIPIQVGGAAPASKPLIENAYQTVELGKRRVMLFSKPVILSPGTKTNLKFSLFENSKGLADLELFLGCFGHCIAISADSEFYLHTHPEGHHHAGSQTFNAIANEDVPNATSGLPALGADRAMMLEMGMNSPSMDFSGPEVVFPIVFPKSGVYKVWGQFKHRGEVLTVPFVVRVP